MALQRSTMGSPADVARRRFTGEEVLRMVEAGVLGEDEPLELLDGELVAVSPQGPIHAALLARLVERLSAAAGAAAHVRPQLPLAAGPESLPEPDVCLVRGSSDAYLHRHPAGSDVLLAVEIVVTAMAEARRKVPIYARAGVPRLWGPRRASAAARGLDGPGGRQLPGASPPRSR